MDVAKKNVGRLLIDTGNILSINEVKMKAGQNTTEELLESLKFKIRTCKVAVDEAECDEMEVPINGNHRSLKLDSYEERKDLKVTVKVFVRQYDGDVIREALTRGFTTLNVQVFDSVVLALRGDNPLPFATIQNAYKILEEFVKEKKVFCIGVSDIETDVFVSLYEWAEVKPGIVQINLAHCCVVPPPLQTFTRENGVQLLTHSDPVDILPDSSLGAAIADLDFPLAKRMYNHSLEWATRYHIHIKCRGVLASKGYILSLTK
ncbi:glutamate--cysteine ligase regulatory subunit-like [Hetaerina americana]|uniref:glutamate--cysteine ligase regulatory subunit-like n=1 Tax=Hetaerina americana TaxID=62018 RepID=UPI003A7F3644